MVQGASRDLPGLAWESRLWAEGYRAVAGIDEVGRGAWAGPVVAAAVILPSNAGALARLLGKVDDSKRLSPGVREVLAESIRDAAVAVGVGSVPAVEIDHIGIVPATRLAMMEALAALPRLPEYLLVDYLTLPEISRPQHGLPHGDAISLSIAAASVVAKVTRDHWMADQDAVYPGYAFRSHKGYGTPEHQQALARLGPCPLHRLSFSPLTRLMAVMAPQVAPAGGSGDGTAPAAPDHTP